MSLSDLLDESKLKHWCPGHACRMNAGWILVPQSGLLDKIRLSIVVPVWLACENELNIGVPVWPAG